jgi:hypothetical protein
MKTEKGNEKKLTRQTKPNLYPNRLLQTWRRAVTNSEVKHYRKLETRVRSEVLTAVKMTILFFVAVLPLQP